MSKWIIVSNRLPFNTSHTGKLAQSSGGLVTAITGIQAKAQTLWVGAAPPEVSAEQWKDKIGQQSKNYLPIFISKKIYDGYYNGFANNVLWPLFHYESNLVRFQWQDWNAYKKVNEKFAEVVAKAASPGDLIWIHDFHLMLVPQLLRKKNKKLKIGFFLHIPFPSSEVFRQLPVRREVLGALLSSDLIGFHDYSYLRHFCASLHLILGLESSLLNIDVGNRKVKLGVFPVGINTKRFQRESSSSAVRKKVRALTKKQNYDFLILGVDRLDYIKGIELKLMSFRQTLEAYPELRGKVSLFQIAVPSRTEMAEYGKLKRRIETLVGQINGKFGKPNYVPVQYMYASLEFPDLLAMYRAADLLLVTSRRDGMNLVALEYLASQNPGDPGVVLLSEFTGAVSTLSHVIPINPWDTITTAKTIAHALEIPRKERKSNHKAMIEYLQKYTATYWAQSFMDSLVKATQFSKYGSQVEIKGANGSVTIPSEIKQAVRRGSLLMMLDYDGTLVPIESSPEKATLSSEALRALNQIRKKKNVQLVVVSGRNSRFLSEQFAKFDISIAAEHGAKFYNARKKIWESLVHTNKQSWYPMALKIMQDYTARVPGSFIEKKDYSLSWHFRKSPAEFAAYQAKKLKEEIELGLSNLPVTVLFGKKIVEARTIEANKGIFARWFLDSNHLDHSTDVLMGMGDDKTDEDLFASFPDSGLTIKVGDGETRAKFRIPDQKSVIPFLIKVGDLVT